MEKVFCHSQDLDGKLKDIKRWNISDQDKNKVPMFFRDYELGKITGRRGTNPEGTMLRYLYFLKVGLENIKGENKADVEEFLEGLLKDKVKTFDKKTREYSGEPYAARSKRDILKILERYLSWKNPSKATLLKGLLNIRIASKRSDTETLVEEEIKKLLEGTEASDKRFFLSVLGSGGLRAEEFHNLRYSDFELPKGKEIFVKLTIRNLFSKTKGRTITLYDKWVLPAAKKYLAERLQEGIKPDEVVFRTTYYGNRNWLSDYGKKILDKAINYHLFRHTAATRLASKMNRQQLCIYFGWAFSSPMPDRYIERAGVNMVDVESKFTLTEYEKQEKLIEQWKTGLEDELEKRRRLDPILNKLIKHPEILKMLGETR